MLLDLLGAELGLKNPPICDISSERLKTCRSVRLRMLGGAGERGERLRTPFLTDIQLLFYFSSQYQTMTKLSAASEDCDRLTTLSFPISDAKAHASSKTESQVFRTPFLNFL